MKKDELEKSRVDLIKFRKLVYTKVFDYRSDALMNLLDALSSNTSAKSVAELSLNPEFEREYGSLYDGIDNYNWVDEGYWYIDSSGERACYEQSQILCHGICRMLPKPENRGYHLIAVDGTPMSRKHSETLEGRSYVYQPNGVPGLKPLTVGYKNSSVVYLPEREDGTKWVVPLLMGRIGVDETEQSKGVEQLKLVLSDPQLPFGQDLVVVVEDSNYSNVKFLYPLLSVYENMVNLSRCRGNRVFYWPAEQPAEGEKRSRGKPRVYGTRFALSDSETWGEPDETAILYQTTASGKEQEVRLQAWSGLIMRGKQGMPMSNHPFTLVQVRVYDLEGTPLYERPMWLMVAGKRRDELSVVQVYNSYIQRFDHEHYFRFSKQNLFLNGFEATDPQHLDNWEQMAMIAYVQLWLARDLAQWMPRPWERYLPVNCSQPQPATPSQVLRDMSRIIRDLGTPALSPKPRGKSPGRSKGQTQVPKKRYRINRKSKKANKAA